MQELLFNVESKELRLAHLKNGQLWDLVVERKATRQLTGNIYRGRVTNVLHNIQSAFIDIDEGESGFIHISDILENTKKFEEMFDMDFDLDYDISEANITKPKNIEDVLKSDQPVLVQVVKEPIGTKGARLTSNISIAGRFLVLLPNSPHRGVSRKIEGRGARERLKKFLRTLEMPKEIGLICRTASAEADTDSLIAEAQELYKSWQSIVEGFNKETRPVCLFEESDLIKKAVVLAVDKKLERILVDDRDIFQTMKRLFTKYEKEHPLKIELYRDKIPMYDRFNVEREIARCLKHKIWLQSGGYLYFQRTEAMYTIDVNSGRSAQKTTSDVEEALVQINMEAAEEIARQLRIRNVGGLVIVDFIDMRSRKNQKRVLERLRDSMKEDSVKCTILGMSEFGLVEMTRQRSRQSLEQTLFEDCPYCNGMGQINSMSTTAIEIERALSKVILSGEHYALRLDVHPKMLKFLEEEDKTHLLKAADRMNARLELAADEGLHINDWQFFSTTSGKPIDV